MAPVYNALKEIPELEPVLISTGQHLDLLDSALRALRIAPDVSLSIMTKGQSPNDVLARVVQRLPPALAELSPYAVLVQGDTTSVLGAAIAAFHLGIRVGHVEAGLRTYDRSNPFPEEANRDLVDRLSTWCFAPTAEASANLRREGIGRERILVTGNTGVDALLWTLSQYELNVWTDDLVLITLHRRESFSSHLEDILNGIVDFLKETPEARAVWPVHPNPRVHEIAAKVLANETRVQQVEPLPYPQFIRLLTSARVVVTDSGGIQEEAPSLGKPVVVARDRTERPEALAGGANRLAGRNRETVYRELRRAWLETPYSGVIPAANPFGDGLAGRRIASHLTAS